MIVTTQMLYDKLSNYSNKKQKLALMVKNKEIYPIVRNLYETVLNTPSLYLAESICNPSYISFDSALAYYQLIPERVVNITSATYLKRKRKIYNTKLFSSFIYMDVPEEAFPYGIDMVLENEYCFKIATKEKALCDKLYSLKPVSNVKELYHLLVNELRIEVDNLKKLNIDDISFLSSKYNCSNIDKFCLLLRRLKNGYLI